MWLVVFRQGLRFAGDMLHGNSSGQTTLLIWQTTYLGQKNFYYREMVYISPSTYPDFTLTTRLQAAH
jgi:hypothetical protein